MITITLSPNEIAFWERNSQMQLHKIRKKQQTLEKKIEAEQDADKLAMYKNSYAGYCISAIEHRKMIQRLSGGVNG